jgi:hypothetical protein
MKEQVNKRAAELREKYGDGVESRVAEVRAEGDSDALRVEGYAAVFNEVTDIGWFREQMAPGCFDDVLEDDVRLLINHDGMPLARTTNDTLSLSVDSKGLKFVAELADTQEARDVHKLVQRGDISQCSFAFYMGEQDITRDEDSNDPELHTVTRVKRLLDVSLVTYPSYSTTSAAARMDEKNIDKPPAPRKLPPDKESTMNLNELRGLRAQKSEEHLALLDTIEKEGRDITDSEVEIAGDMASEVEKLDRQIEVKSQQAAMRKRLASSAGHLTGSNGPDSEQREIDKINESFSLTRAITCVANNRHLTGAELEWQQEASRELNNIPGAGTRGQVGIPTKAMTRALGDADEHSATTGSGVGFVPTVVPGVIDALRAPSVVEQLGTTVINATGNLSLPRITTAAVSVAAAETAAATASTQVMDALTLTPNRAGAKTSYSKQLLMQGGPGVDAMIARDLAGSINAFVDDYAFDKVLAGTTAVAGTALTGALAADMEAAVLGAGGDLSGGAYAFSPAAYALAKVSERVDAVSSTWDLSTNSFNGYRAMSTPYLVDSAGTTGQAVFGNWAQGLILAYFGGLDLEIDPYSEMTNQNIVLHVNRWFDAEVRQATALSQATLLATATY